MKFARLSGRVWQIHADVKTPKGSAVVLEVMKQGEQTFRPVNEQQAKAAEAALQKAAYKVAAREDKPTQSRPSAPFITSTCSRQPARV